jgi:nucleoside-diphosphate-sugar epimerase
VLDRQATGEDPGVRRVDITDFDALCEQAQGQEAIVHLAALPAPGIASGPETFRINATGTYNVFEAAAVTGIRRVACASSINALGFNFGIKLFDIPYFPVDEDMPGFTTDPYSFSKQVTESIAAYYWRREEISSVCLRMPMVVPFNDKTRRMGQGFHPRFRQAWADLLALPEAQQAEQARQLAQLHAERRAGRPAEQPRDRSSGGPNPPPSDDLAKLLLFGYSDFWTILSGEDTAQAFEKGVTADYEGSHVLHVNESHNFPDVESEKLARLFFPEAARKRPLEGSESLVSIEKARRLIGFEPEYSVAAWFETGVDPVS